MSDINKIAQECGLNNKAEMTIPNNGGSITMHSDGPIDQDKMQKNMNAMFDVLNNTDPNDPDRMKKMFAAIGLELL